MGIKKEQQQHNIKNYFVKLQETLFLTMFIHNISDINAKIAIIKVGTCKFLLFFTFTYTSIFFYFIALCSHEKFMEKLRVSFFICFYFSLQTIYKFKDQTFGS